MEERQEEFYPMPLFLRLAVEDVAASAAWYEEALGFRSLFAMPGPENSQVMNHLRLGRYQDLMLVAEGAEEAGENKGVGVIIYLNVDDGVEALAERARSTGSAVEGPEPTPWNTIEVRVTDPDGFTLAFSQVNDPTLSFTEVMQPGG